MASKELYNHHHNFYFFHRGIDLGMALVQKNPFIADFEEFEAVSCMDGCQLITVAGSERGLKWAGLVCQQNIITNMFVSANVKLYSAGRLL